MDLFVVLPAYNEEMNIGGLLATITASMERASLRCRIIVVNDGSKDRTAEILENAKISIPGLTIVTHAQNMGLGATIRDGLAAAAEAASGDDVIVSMDADETHTPDLIPAMLAKLDEGADVVVASRYRPESKIVGLARHREAISVIASWLLRAAFPTHGLRDYTCGFRAYRASALKLAFATYGRSFVDQADFECMVDIALKMRRLSLKFAEVPMVLRYDFKRGASKMRIWKTGTATLRLLIKRRFESGPSLSK